MLTNLEEGTDLTESVNRALRVMRFTIHTGLKRTPFELHHGRKPRTELTNIVKDGKNIFIRLVRNIYFSTKQTEDSNLCGPRCGWRKYQSYGHGKKQDRREASQ